MVSTTGRKEPKKALPWRRASTNTNTKKGGKERESCVGQLSLLLLFLADILGTIQLLTLDFMFC